MSGLTDLILNQTPQQPQPPQRGPAQQPGGLLELLRRLILHGGSLQSSPSVFDTRDAMQQHNLQLQRSLNPETM